MESIKKNSETDYHNEIQFLSISLTTYRQNDLILGPYIVPTPVRIVSFILVPLSLERDRIKNPCAGLKIGINIASLFILPPRAIYPSPLLVPSVE